LSSQSWLTNAFFACPAVRIIEATTIVQGMNG